MDLNWLRDFECLARTLNFTRAADKRNITQSAFSRRIKALESWVGLPLINRATYPVQLSEAGQQFLPIAIASIARLSEARQTLRDADKGDARLIRFAVLHTISVNYLAPRLEQIQALMPELRSRVRSDSLSTCCDLLVEGAVDILLCYAHHAVAPMIDETGFARKALTVDRLIPVAAAGPAQRHGWSLDVQGAAPLPYLAYERTSFLGMVVDSTIDGKAMEAETLYVDGLVEAIKRRMLAGAGFAWMPETAIAADLAAGRVVQIGGAPWQASLTISAFANPDQFDAPARAVWDML